MSLKPDEIQKIKVRYHKEMYSRVSNLVRRIPIIYDADDVEKIEERRKLRIEYIENLKDFESKLRKELLQEWLRDKSLQNINVISIKTELEENFEKVLIEAIESFDNSTKI
jgi:hypothetical protein